MPYTISTRLSGFPLNQVITWNIVHGSTTDADFVGTSGTFLLNNGYPSTRGTNTLAIPIAGDNLNEGDETFSIELSAGAFSTEGPLTVTLDDDDDDTVFTVTGQARVTEPTVSVGRSNYYTYTVTRSGAPLTADTTVEWVLIHGTTSAADVSGGGTSAIDVNGSIRGTLTFSPGVDVMTFGVNIARDTLTETDETFTLTTYDPDPNIFSGVPLTVTIAATAGTDALAWIRDAGAATVITAGETIQVPLVILGGGPRPGIRVIGYCITGSVEAADYSVVTRIFTPRTFFANPYSSRGGCPDGPGPGGFLDFRLRDNERNLPIVVANSAAGKTLTVTLISHGNVLSGSTTYRYDPAPRTYNIITDTAPAFAAGTTQPGLTYVQNTPIPALTLPPASAGNGATTYTLTPLPDGLTFTAGTRILSGTPATVAGAVALTYTAADADGDSDTLTFSVTVIAPDTAPAFAAGTTPPAQTYTVGVGITALTLPLAGGGNGTVTYALSPAVAGLTFDPGTRVLSGTPTTVADAVALTYTAADSDDNTDASDEIRLTFVVTITPAPAVVIAPVTLTVLEAQSEIYTVRISAAPSGGDVTVTPTAGAGLTLSRNGVSLSPSGALTFTADNWNTAQTITVAAAEDDDAVNDTVTISHAVIGADYGGVDAADVTVTITENDRVGFEVIQTALTVNESATDTYTVRLTSAPSIGNVTVMPSSRDVSVVTVSTTALVFTAGNWNTHQTVTVTGVADDDAVADAPVSITNAVTASDDSSDYDGATADGVTVTVTDTDMAGITIAPPIQTVAEGADAVYSVVLDTEPSAIVTVMPMTPTLPAGLTVETTDLTALSFTTGDWNVAQTVSLTVLDDEDALGGDIALTYTATGGDYAAATASVTFTVTDNMPPRGLTVSADALSVVEGGSRTYNVALTSQPVGGDVTVTPASGDTSVATLSPVMLTFTATSWNTPMTVTVTGAHDADASATGDTATITHAVNPGGSGYTAGITAADNVVVTVTEDDMAGITLAPPTQSVNEGADAVYSVVLDTEPSADVTVMPMTPTLPAGLTVETTDLTALSFTTGDWNVAQTVSLTVLDDSDALGGDIALTYTATGGDYAAATASVTFTVTDNVPPRGLTISVDALSVEEGGSRTYTVALTSQPVGGDVTVMAASGDISVATVSGALTFTGASWNDAQTVTVTGEQNAATSTKGMTTTLTHTINPGASDYVAGDTDTDDNVVVTIADTAPAFADGVTQPDQTYTTGAAITALTLPAAGGGNGAATYALDVSAVAGLTFTAATRVLSGTPRGVTAAVVLTYTAADSDDNSAATDTATLTFAVTVNPASSPQVALTPATLTVVEDGSATYSVALLGAPPAGALTVTPSVAPASPVLTLSADGGAPASGDALTFTADNWNQAQTVTVAAAADADGLTNIVTISHTTSGANYTAATAALPVSVFERVTVGFAQNAYTVAENAGVVNVCVSVSTPAVGGTVEGLFSVLVSTTDGTATSPADYAALSDSAVTATTDPRRACFNITIADNEVAESSETFTVSITGVASGNSVLEPAIDSTTATVTLTDDDTAGVTVTQAVTPLSVPEDGSGFYTVQLNTDPAATTVTITPLSADPSVATVSDALTFVSAGANWNIAQTVTVRGVEDADAIADAVVSITHAVANYGGATARAVPVQVTEDDTDRVAVMPTTRGVTEGAATFYTVMLETQPAGEVTVTPGVTPVGHDLTLSRNGVPLMPSNALVFTTANWNEAQTVSVTAGEDDDGNDDSATISHTVSGYGSVVAGDVGVMVTDDDMRGVTIDPATLLVDEDGNDTYTVRLDTEPDGEVTVMPSSGDDDIATIAPVSLVFTTGNWNDAQSVTVTGIKDADAVADAAVAIANTLSGSADYAGITAGSVTVTVSETDMRGVMISTASLGVTESEAVAYAVVLTAAPSGGDVTVTPMSDAPAATVSGELVFTAGTWNTAQSVTVTGVEDANSVADTANITHAVAGADYDGIAANPVAVMVTDNDTPGVTVDPVTLTVNEGGNGAYTVRLTTEPGGNVTITPVSDTPAATVSGALVFTIGTWNVAQTVTVTGAHDADASNAAANITHTVSGYGGVTIEDVAVTIIDDETAGVTVNPVTLTVNEGGINTYTVRLDSEPSGNVMVTPASNNSAAAIVSPTGGLVFTAGTWNTPQMVTVSGIDDADAVNATANIMHSVSGYGSVSAAAPVAVTVTDDETAGVTISLTRLSVNEGGGAGSAYTVVLNTEPSGAVVVVPSSDNGEVSVSPNTLNFNAGDWSAPKTVVVSAAEDDDGNDDTATISHAVSGADYAGINADSVTVRVTDDDPRGVMISTATVGMTEGESAFYGVVLIAAPSGGDVTVTPVSDVTATATVSGALVFTGGNWNRAQTVTVTGVEDANGVTDTANITHTVAGADYGSNGINAATVAATVNDNDTPGVMISTDSLTVAEGGNGTYSVRLTTQPGGNVVITPSSDTPATVSGALTFSAGNWNVAQRVTVAGAQDADAVDAGANITHTVSGYGDVTAENVAVTIIDDETAGVTVNPARLSVNEGSSSGAGNTYTVVLDSAPSGAVIVMLSSDNPDVSVNRATLNFNAGNWNVTQTVVVSAADDDDGNDDTATISHTLSGADYAGVSAAPVVVTVTDDEVPGITLSTRTMAVNEGGNSEYTIRLNTSPSGNATVTPSSSDAAVTVSPTALVFTRDNWSMGQQVRVAGADDADGLDDTATITHAIAGYAGVTAADSVAVTVTDNDLPAVTISPQTLTVDEGDGAIYTVRLATEPSGEVTVAPSSGDVAIATVSGALSFTTGNWNTAQSVTVSGARIDGVDDDRVIIAHTVSGADYAAVTAASVAVSVRADRIVFTPPADLPVSADGNLQAPLGGSIPYTLVLSTPPAAGERVVVTLTLSHGAPFSVTATGGLDLAVTNHIEDIVRAFTFTSANWNVPQTAMFTVPADDPPGTMYTLTPTRTDGGGTDYAIAAPLVFVAAAASAAGELDALNEVILPEMARALSDRQVGAIARRVEAARAAGAGAGLRVGGQSSPAALAATQMSAAADEGLDGKRLLGASDFVLPLNAGADGGAGAAFWGGGDYRHLGGESGEIDWDGDLLSLNVGVDAHLQNDLLVGVMVSWSEADLDYTDDSADTRRSGDYELDMTGVHPYLGWSTFSGGLDLWTTLGYGSGEVEITHDENATRSSSDVALRTVGIGGSGRLLALGESELRVKAEAFSTRTEVEGGDAARLSELEVSVSRMRLALQAGTSVITATGARAEPSLELGYRYDGGDGETGGGVELGSALRYTSPAHGVTLEGHIRALMGHSGDSKELSIGGNLRLSAGADGQGLSLSLSPGYGATGSGVEDIWKGGLSADTDPQARLNARVGYGLPGAIFMLTPYGEMALGEDERNYRFGFRWGLDGEVDLDLVGRRHKKDDAAADHAIWFKGEVRF